MLTEMLPQEAINELKLARLEHGPYEMMVQHLRAEQHRFLDGQVAEVTAAQQFGHLPGQKKLVAALTNEGEDLPKEEPPSSKVTEQLQAVCAALEKFASSNRGREPKPPKGKGKGKGGSKQVSKNGSKHSSRGSSPARERPDAKWPGKCWHCGTGDHPRGKCKEYIQLCEDYGGKGTRKPPPSYDGGQYAKWVKAGKPSTLKVHALLEEDHAETGDPRELLINACLPVDEQDPGCMPFDDEEQMVQALSQAPLSG